MLFYLLIAVLAGISTVISRIINFKLAEKIGIFQGTLINYIVGLLGSLILLLISQEHLTHTLPQLRPIHILAFLGGLAGVVVVTLSSYMTPKISSFYLTLFIFIGQLFVGLLIDYAILSQLSIGKLVGGILVLAGLVYNLYTDKITD